MTILVLEHPRVPSTPHFNDIANTPLWSCVLAGYVHASLRQAGLKPAFLDANEEGLDFSQTTARILKINPDLLTINGVYFWEHSALLFEMLTDLRQANYTGHINLFGFFPTLHHRRILQENCIDSIAVGECEQTIVELAQNLSSSTEGIMGLATANHLFTPRKQTKNLDAIPFPHRTKTQLKQTISILASRGCYNHCSFCPIPSFYNDGPLWRGRSVANIMEEIIALAKEGCLEFYFIDPNFIGPGKAGRQRILELLNQLRPLKIHFGMETRATDLDDELMGELVQAGLTSLLIGVESGSGSGLADFGKNESVQDSERAIGICRRAGVEPEIGFLMFTPDSSKQSLLDNLDFLTRNKLLDRLDRTANLLCHSQIIMAGTTGYSQYQKRGILQEYGPLGFIGAVNFQDKMVGKTAEAITALCHFILRETGRKDSPLYFKTASYHQFMAMNDLLVEEVRQYILEPDIGNVENSLQKLQVSTQKNNSTLFLSD
jgi:hypothetical protein